MAQEKVYESSTSIGFDGKWSSFSDNYDDLDKWISKNRIYPKEAIDKKEEGKVDVTFIVEKDGSLSSIEIKNSASPSLDAEALRLASTMPKWKCAYNYGVPCRSRNQFSVYFRLPKIVSKPQVQTETTPSNSQPTNNSSSTGDNWACNNGQKIYEGEYELFGRSGNAKYQYREGPNRSRIFDGHFIYVGNTYAEGDFKDNHQVGEWKFENSPIGDVRITFDENKRIITGAFSHRYDIYGNNIYCQADGNFMRADDGHLYGPIIYGDKRKNRITFIEYRNSVTGFLYGRGDYNLDGKEKGKWLFKQGEGDRFKSITAKYDDYGNLLESYYIENSTGDKIPWGVEQISKYIRTAVDNHWEMISSFFLRDTEKYY